MTGEFLTIDEVSKRLKITRQTVSKYIQVGRLKAIRVNKQYRIDLESLYSFTGDDPCVHSPSATYSISSRNCSLEYQGKYQDDFFSPLQNKVSFKKTVNSHAQQCNSLYLGDNKIVMSQLLQQFKNSIDLVYIDPPFGTGQVFSFNNEEHAYDDTLVNHEFLEFLRQRFTLLREMLSNSGSIYVHIDKKIGHYVKVIMDEVFGYKNFINDITRIKCNPKNFDRMAYGNYSDMILFYAKNNGSHIWNDVRDVLSDEQRKRLFPRLDPKRGPYTTNPLHAPGTTHDGDTGEEWKGLKPPTGRHWRYSRKELDRLDKAGLIEWSSTGNPRKIVYANDHIGTKTQDVWEYKDIGLSGSVYPTQKNYSMLERIVLNSSNQNSIVLDCFSGSGMTLLAAASNGRNFIGIDRSKKAVDIALGLLNSKGIKANIFELLK